MSVETFPNFGELPSVSPDYRSQIEAILDKPITPNTINTYAGEALEDLIAVASSVTGNYIAENDPLELIGKELENTAFAHHELTDITAILNHVGAKVVEIEAIDVLIRTAEVAPYTIVPPADSPGITAGSGEGIAAKELIPRLKTVLFILSNEYGVDIHDSGQLHLVKGTLTDNMMRKTSYYTLNVSALDRTIHICDEEGNVSYVFDAKQLAAQRLSTSDISVMDKPQLNELITTLPKVGSRIVYSKKFVSDVLNAIDNPESSEHDLVKPERILTLAPKVELAPKDYLSIRGMAKQFGVSDPSVQKAVTRLVGGGYMTVTEPRRFGYGSTSAYSPVQQGQIAYELWHSGYLYEQAPEDHLPAYSVAAKLGVSKTVLHNTVDRLITSGEMETPEIRKFTTRFAKSFSPEQQSIITYELWHSGNLEAPKGYLSTTGIAEKLGTDKKNVRRAVDRLVEAGEIDAPTAMKFGSLVTSAYSPELQGKITYELWHSGYLYEQAPEGHLPIKGIANKLEISDRPVQKTIARMTRDGLLAAAELRKFGYNTVPAYSPQQQGKITYELWHSNTIKP